MRFKHTVGLLVSLLHQTKLFLTNEFIWIAFLSLDKFLHLKPSMSFIGMRMFLWFIAIKDLLTNDSWWSTNWRPLGNLTLFQKSCLMWDMTDYLSQYWALAKLPELLFQFHFFYLNVSQRRFLLLPASSYWCYTLKKRCISHIKKMHHWISCLSDILSRISLGLLA